MLTEVKASSVILLYRHQVDIMMNMKTLYVKKRLYRRFARLSYVKCRVNAGDGRVKKNEK